MDKNYAGASNLNTLGFHGSYRPQDVTFYSILMILNRHHWQKRVFDSIREKHYSQMISVEHPLQRADASFSIRF